MCHAILLSFGCSPLPLRDHNSTCRLYPNYLSACPLAISSSRPCTPHNIRPLYVITALECPACLFRAQNYSTVLGTHAFAPGTNAHDAVKGFLQERLKLVPMRWPRPVLERIVQKWGSKKLPDEEGVRRKLECVEEALGTYQQITLESRERGPNARLHIVGDGEVGKDGVEGVGRTGSLRLRWVEGDEPGSGATMHGSGESAEEAIPVVDSDDTAEDTDDERSPRVEEQVNQRLSRLPAIPEEIVSEEAHVQRYYTRETMMPLDNPGEDEPGPSRQRPAAEDNLLVPNTNPFGSWSPSFKDWANNPDSFADLASYLALPDALLRAATGSNDLIHVGQIPTPMTPMRDSFVPSNADWHFATTIDKPIPHIHVGHPSMPCLGTHLKSSQRENTQDIDAFPGLVHPIFPFNDNDINDDNAPLPWFPEMSMNFPMDPGNVFGEPPPLPSTREGNGVVNLITPSPDNPTMPFELGQPLGFRDPRLGMSMAEMLASDYVPNHSNEQPRRIPGAPRPKRRAVPNDHSSIPSIEQRPPMKRSEANGSSAVDPSPCGRPNIQYGNIALQVPRMGSQRPQSFESAAISEVAGPSRKRKNPETNWPNGPVDPKRTRR